MSDDMVEFAGRLMRPGLAAEVVTLELMAGGLERGLRHHVERGGKAQCGCPLRIDGTEPYLHRPDCVESSSDALDGHVARWLRERAPD